MHLFMPLNRGQHDFLLSFAAKLVEKGLPDIGDHGNVDDRVEHPVEQADGQSPVKQLIQGEGGDQD